MTMRTYYYFACSNGHRGEQKISENDQPYSKMWESVALKGMGETTDASGKKVFVCGECGQPMLPAAKPA